MQSEIERQVAENERAKHLRALRQDPEYFREHIAARAQKATRHTLIAKLSGATKKQVQAFDSFAKRKYLGDELLERISAAYRLCVANDGPRQDLCRAAIAALEPAHVVAAFGSTLKRLRMGYWTKELMAAKACVTEADVEAVERSEAPASLGSDQLRCLLELYSLCRSLLDRKIEAATGGGAARRGRKPKEDPAARRARVKAEREVKARELNQQVLARIKFPKV